MPVTRPNTPPAGGPEYDASKTQPERFTQRVAGAQTVGTGKATFVNDTGKTLHLRSVKVSVGTAPTGADLIVDVNLDGTTIFSAQTQRPKVVAGSKSGVATPAQAGKPVKAAAGATITVDVDQIGSTVAGSDLVVTVEGVLFAEGAIDPLELAVGATLPHSLRV